MESLKFIIHQIQSIGNYASGLEFESGTNQPTRKTTPSAMTKTNNTGMLYMKQGWHMIHDAGNRKQTAIST